MLLLKMNAIFVVVCLTATTVVKSATLLGSNSCSGRCDTALDRNSPCQCNSACLRYEDCCQDYWTVCLGTGGAGTGDTDLSLSTIGDALWQADTDRASLNDVRYSLQSQTSSSSTSDVASNPLFAYVSSNLLNKAMYSSFIRLLDNYERNTGRTEHLSGQEWDEVDAFLAEVVSSGPMQKAAEYLCSKGLVTCNNQEAMKEKLRSLWFELYPRSGSSGAVVDSSGFEHVFVGETKSSSVTGFHSWVQFYLQEAEGDLNYQGFVSEKEPVVLNTRLTWHGLQKKQASFFVRSSPAFDMALYTVCILEKPGQRCSVNVQGQAITIQTYDVGHKSGLQVASAFPAI